MPPDELSLIKLTMPPVAIECVRNIRREALASFWEACHVAKQVDKALAGNQELQSYVQHHDSGLVDEDQALPDELNYLTGTLCPARFPAQT